MPHVEVVVQPVAVVLWLVQDLGHAVDQILGVHGAVVASVRKRWITKVFDVAVVHRLAGAVRDLAGVRVSKVGRYLHNPPPVVGAPHSLGPLVGAGGTGEFASGMGTASRPMTSSG